MSKRPYHEDLGPIEPRQAVIPLNEKINVKYHRENNLLSCKLLDPDIPVEDIKEDLVIVEDEVPVYLIPKLPDLSIVLRMDHSLVIAPKSHIRTLVNIPLIPSFAVKHNKKQYRSLLDYPLVSLSKTWFGDPVSGEPAYSLNTALNNSEEHIPQEGFASCRLKITNDSIDLLSFQRLILRVPFFSLFHKEGHFFTNSMAVRYKGIDQVSQVNIGNGPDRREHYELFSGPQLKKELMGLKKSFYFIKSLTNI